MTLGDDVPTPGATSQPVDLTGRFGTTTPVVPRSTRRVPGSASQPYGGKLLIPRLVEAGGWYKEVRGLGDQVDLDQPDDAGLRVEAGCYPMHPDHSCRIFTNLGYPPSYALDVPFQTVRTEGLPYAGWVNLPRPAAEDAAPAVDDAGWTKTRTLTRRGMRYR